LDNDKKKHIFSANLICLPVDHAQKIDFTLASSQQINADTLLHLSVSGAQSRHCLELAVHAVSDG
jgi:hypothetical protein